MSRARTAALLLGLLLALGAAGCTQTQSRANLPGPIDLRPGVTTRHDVLMAWGSPFAIRDEPGDRTVLSYRNEVGEGWGVALGPPVSLLWVLDAGSLHQQVRSAEIFFLPDDRLEKVRVRDLEGHLKVIQ